MAERVTDIIMSAPMVLGLLREIEVPGSGKTQTRRLAYDKRGRPSKWLRLHRWRLAELEAGRQPEVRIWVRETWQSNGLNWGKAPRDMHRCLGRTFYRATDHGGWKPYWGPWKPSIHMPREFSRITLDLKETGLERLQGISRADAIAEGIQRVGGGALRWENWSGAEGQCGMSPEAAFALLWNSLHGAGAWAANPEVVPLTFRPTLQNIDRREAGHG